MQVSLCPLSPNKTLEKRDSHPILNSKRLFKIYNESLPLTEIYKDPNGLHIQLWKTKQYGLIGAVFNPEGNLKIISGLKIRNPLNAHQTSDELTTCLENSANKSWQIAYNINDLSLTIWPHICAAGKNDGREVRDIRINGSPIRYTSEAALIKQLESHGYRRTSDKHFVNDSKGMTAHLDREGVGNHTKAEGYKGTHVDFRLNAEKTRENRDKRESVRQGKENEIRDKVKSGSVSEREGQKQIYSLNKQFKAQEESHSNFRAKWRFAYGQERPNDPSGNKQGPNSSGNGPGGKSFQQTLQQTRLTDSYNSTHANNPVPARGATGGDIGGVACSTDYIDKLFTGPEALFEREHFFCLPALPDGKAPFTDLELRQILRELAIGIYVHSTIPFFSLHFNQNADQFPVIHPAYENTLVGRVISMLDYMMKGYLNGGVFNEKFIDEWHSDPNWSKKEKSALSNLIDFSEYSQKHLSGEDQNYKSLRMMQNEMSLLRKEGLGEKLEKELGVSLGLMTKESPVLEKYSGFRNSFRIIAKQKSIQKEGNLFLIDSDFDVLYTITPSPEYKAAVEEHFRKHGKLPASFANMEMTYKLFAKRIHDHMAKLPICRDYFAMLSVINFFSGYFSTLKQHRKIPVLPSLELGKVKGCPSLFPHLPISTVIQEKLQVNMFAALSAVTEKYHNDFLTYCNQVQIDVLYKTPASNFKARNELIAKIKKAIHDNIIASSSPMLRRIIIDKVNESKDIQESLFKHARSFIDSIDEIIEKQLSTLVPTFLSSTSKMFGEAETIAILDEAKSNSSRAFTQFFTTLHASLIANNVETPNEEGLLGAIQSAVSNKYSHVPRYKAEEVAGQILEHLKKNFSNISKRISSIFKNVLEVIDDKAEDIFKIPFTATRVKTEMPPEEVEVGKKVVGGCGMHLQSHAVQTSLVAAKILQSNWQTFQKMKPESWTEVSFGNSKSKGFAFSTVFEDVPAWVTDDYEWMESLLIIPKGSDLNQIQERIEIQDAIQQNRHEAFDKLVSAAKSLNDNLRDRDQRTLLHHAANSENPYYVKTLLSKGLSATAVDSHGFLPIHYSASRGTLESLKLLLKSASSKTAMVNATSRNGTTPIVCAIQNAKRPTVQFLLANGAKNHNQTEGYTVLHCALHHGDPGIIDDILANDSIVSECINQLSDEGGTPLTLSCELDSKGIVEKLLNLKADPKITRKDGVSCIEVPIMRNCKPVVEVLMRRIVPSSHAIQTAAKQASIEILQLLIVHSYFFQHRSSYKDTVLHTAIRYGNIEGAIFIAKKCDDVNFLNEENQEKETAFALAAAMGAWDLIEILQKKNAVSQNSIIACLPRLLKAEYHPTLKTLVDSCNFNEKSLQKYALMAAQAGNYQALSFIFVPAGVKLESLIGPNGWGISHYLAKSDGIHLFRKILIKEQNFLQPLKDEENRTLPYIAASNRSTRVFRLILEQMRKMNTSLANHYKDRHLLYGVLEGASIKCLRNFFEIYHDKKNEFINASLDTSGTRPVHLAAKMCSLGVLKFLISEGSDIKVQDANGFNVLCFAIRAHSEKLITYLLKEDASLIIGQALYLAACDPSEDIFSKLRKLNASQEILDEALFIAVREFNHEAFMRLRRNGATFNFTSKEGWTPLLFSSSTGQVSILSEILKDKTIRQTVIKGNNALHEASKNGHIPCVHFLLKSGYKNELNQNNQSPWDLSHKGKSLQLLLTNKDKYEKKVSAFSTVITSPMVNVSKLVLEISALPLNEPIQIELESNLIWGTPFQLLLRVHGKSVTKDAISRLMKHPDLDPNRPDSDGNTVAHLLLQANIFPKVVKPINWTLVNHEKESPLHTASKFADLKVLQKTLEALKQSKQLKLIDGIDIEGRTPIYYAIVRNKDANVDCLLAWGASVDIYDRHLITPLILAYINPTPSLPIVKSLLAYANPNQPGTPERLSPLHLSLTFENDEITRCLLFNGANCSTTMVGNTSLLHAAAQSGKLHLMRLFAARGLSLEDRDKKGMLPIHHAAVQGETETVKAILSIQKDMLNAPIEKPEVNYRKVEIEEKEKGSKIMSGATPIFLAAARQNTETIRFFLKNNANVEIQTKSNSNILSFAAQSSSKSTLELFSPYKISRNPQYLCPALGSAIARDNLDAVQYLYSLGIAINSDIINGFTGIQLASQHGALLTTAWLLNQNADPMLTSPTGEDSFQISAGNDSVAQFELILEFAAPDIDELRNKRETLLHTASKAGKLSNVVYLLKNFASINVKDNRGNLPIHLAVQNGHAAIASLLLICGADFIAKAPNGKALNEIIPANDTITKKALADFAIVAEGSTKRQDTKLHLAVRCRNPLAVLLLTHLESVDKRNGENLTPLHIAIETEQIEICRILLTSGADVNAKDSIGKTPLARSKNPEIIDLIKNAGGSV